MIVTLNKLLCLELGRLATNSYLSRFAGAERGSCVSQFVLNSPCDRIRATKHTPRNTFSVLERRHGLLEIVERGAVVFAERHRVSRPHPDRGVYTLSENVSRHGYRFA